MKFGIKNGIGFGRSIGLSVMLAGGAWALAGCSSAPPLFSADGRPTQQIQCPAYGGWKNCADNAKVLCPAGYDVLDQSTENNQNSLLVACKGS
ncbi:hypothetical protein [Caballeronia glebae]|jgi:hypothetical protein|uniref:Lipoprotein n=1 Tax=Caballeronia glebae TaxID=1777143 RepID=A0A158ADP0_9BURK|nr:hypothetical protein [Caballeronia glebae]SAK55829.1 hypothetical protein AWB82_02147 [Caballeronia glebae]